MALGIQHMTKGEGVNICPKLRDVIYERHLSLLKLWLRPTCCRRSNHPELEVIQGNRNIGPARSKFKPQITFLSMDESIW